MELVLSLIFDIGLTAAAYLIVPIIITIIGYKKLRLFSLSTIKKIVIVNGICVWLIIQIIRTYHGITGTSYAVFLWSGIAYAMMKKFLTIGEKRKENAKPFKTIDKAQRGKIAIVTVSLLLIISFGFNIYQFNAQSKLESELENTAHEKQDLVDEYIAMNDKLKYELEQTKERLNFFTTTVSELNREKEANEEKIAFFDEYVVFVEDDGTSQYHEYDCYRFKGDYFWAYNIEQAIDRGFKPCPICCK